MRGIKKIVLGTSLLLSGFLIGCGGSAIASSAFNMDYLQSDLINWVGDFYLYEDSETHVEYIIYDDGTDGVAITPILKSDGSVYVK